MMKNRGIKFLTAAGLMVGLLAFTSVKQGGIKGSVSPADGAQGVMAIKGTDTIKASINSGSFVLGDLKAGTYTVIVKAITPYKDAFVENVVVTDTTVADVGEIQLTQQKIR